jgi:hypothetical protein
MKRGDLIEMISSWENLDLFPQYVADHPEDLSLLMDIALDDSKPEFWRAAWIIDKINIKNPELISPYLPALFRALKKTRNLSKMRHFLKIMTYHPVPVKQQGFLFDYCMNSFASQDIPVAVRAHALQILFNISQAEPELKPELIQILEHELSLEQSAGIRARGKNILSLLHRKSTNSTGKSAKSRQKSN